MLIAWKKVDHSFKMLSQFDDLFDGDFEGYLKDIGVDGEHIKKIVIQPSQVSMTRRRQKKVLAN